MNKPKFDPNKPFQVVDNSTKPKFDPNMPFETNEVSQLESTGRGLLQGGSLGFSDEITGALESGAGSLGLVPDKTYEQSRDESRLANEAARSANPMSYGAGELAGGVASSFILPGSGISHAARIGAISGLGLANTPEQILPNMALGGALSGAVAGASPYVAKGLRAGSNKLGEYLTKKAEQLAVKATGATGKQASKFLDNAGRQLLDKRLVKFGSSPEDVFENVKAAKEQAGQNIGSALESLDAQGGSLDVEPLRAQLAAKIRELRTIPGNEKIVKQLRTELENLDAYQTDLPLSIAEKAKRNFDDQVNFASPESDKAVAKQVEIGRAHV